MSWYVGQKVVCIDDNWVMKIITHKETLPKKNQIYTIRDVLPIGEHLYLRLSEIVNKPDWYKNPIGGGVIWGEICFSEKRFRPLESIESKESSLDSIDISVFHKILDDVNSKQKVPKKTKVPLGLTLSS